MTARLIGGNYAGQEAVPGPEATPYQRQQDEWQRFLVRGVAEAIGRWLKENGRLSRRVSQLEIYELEAIGIAACAEYVRLREAEWARQQTQETILDLSHA